MENKIVSPYSRKEFLDYIDQVQLLRKSKNEYDVIRLKGLVKIVTLKAHAAFKKYLRLTNKEIKRLIKDERLSLNNTIKDLKEYKNKEIKFIKKFNKGRSRIGKIIEENRSYFNKVKQAKKEFNAKCDKIKELRLDCYIAESDYLTKINLIKCPCCNKTKLNIEKKINQFSIHRTRECAQKVGKKVVGYKGFGLSSTIVVLLVLLAVFSKDSFYNWTSFSAVLNTNAVYAILAVGIMFVLLTGGIDISIASTLAVSACTVSELMKLAPTINPILWVLVAITIGAVCGLINGFLIGKLNIAPMIATLGTMFAYRGLAYVITGGEQIKPGDFEKCPGFTAISRTMFLGITTATWTVLIIIVLAAIFLMLTRPGRRLYAIGTNERSAEINGTNVSNVKIMAYTICGALAGLAGIIFAANIASVHSEVAMNFEMTAIAMCVIGGVSNKGGKGRVDCLVLGIFFLSLLMTLLAKIPSLSSLEEAIKGGIIVIAVVINIINDNIQARKEVLEMGRRL